MRSHEVGRSKRKAYLKFKALQTEEKSRDYKVVKYVHSRTKKIEEDC
jgi:hypothetical protein